MIEAARVLKFGGSSLATPERVKKVAHLVAEHRKVNTRVVVVVSAMGDSTDELIDLALKVSANARAVDYRREMDMLLTSGERVSMSLLSMALRDLGCDAMSFTGSQSGIITDTVHGEARISDLRPIRIEQTLSQSKIAIVAGFQGVSAEKEVTTLGRGGSDTSAVALAVYFKASCVYIYTDVDGFYSADPRVVSKPKRINKISWNAALEAAYGGAQVLHPRCIELAWKHKLPIKVCSSFIEQEVIAYANTGGTLVDNVDLLDKSLESPTLLTISVQKNLVLLHRDTSKQSHRESVTELKKWAEKGFRQLLWNQSQSRTEILVEQSQLGLVDQTWQQDSKRAETDTNLTRVCLVGAGLSHAWDLQLKLSEKAEELGLRQVMYRANPTSLDFVFQHSESAVTEFVKWADAKLLGAS